MLVNRRDDDFLEIDEVCSWIRSGRRCTGYHGIHTRLAQFFKSTLASAQWAILFIVTHASVTFLAVQIVFGDVLHNPVGYQIPNGIPPGNATAAVG